MPAIISMDGPLTLNPSDMGTKKKWKFRNDTGEPIFDFFLKTGPVAFLEIELPFFGTTGNPPDMRKFTLREEGHDEGSKTFDDEVEGKATLDPPIEAGKEFEIEMEFDAVFEPKEYFQITPTDRNGVTIEGDRRVQSDEAQPGIKEALEAAGKIVKTVADAGIKTEEPMAKLEFDEKRGKAVLAFANAAPKRGAPVVVAVERAHIKREAHFGLERDFTGERDV